jgi:hypothetical protein
MSKAFTNGIHACREKMWEIASRRYPPLCICCGTPLLDESRWEGCCIGCFYELQLMPPARPL